MGRLEGRGHWLEREICSESPCVIVSKDEIHMRFKVDKARRIAKAGHIGRRTGRWGSGGFGEDAGGVRPIYVENIAGRLCPAVRLLAKMMIPRKLDR